MMTFYEFIQAWVLSIPFCKHAILNRKVATATESASDIFLIQYISSAPHSQHCARDLGQRFLIGTLM